jgi:diguanylate cyclase (GGDEF)-like protein
MEKNIELRRVHEELKRLNDDLRIQAESDPLTGFFNQQKMHLIIEEEIEKARKSKAPLAMIMFDFDDFKRINDTYGHLKGDEILKDVSSIARASLRSTDYAFRYGGEEFLILLPLTGLQNASLVANRIREGIEAVPFPVTISAGVSIWEGEDNTKFIQKTDKLLYKAKEEGKNRVRSQ